MSVWGNISIPIEKLLLSARTYNCLKHVGINSIG